MNILLLSNNKFKLYNSIKFKCQPSKQGLKDDVTKFGIPMSKIKSKKQTTKNTKQNYHLVALNSN